jgi:hypothetical protein
MPSRLLAAGVSVIALRPGRLVLTPEMQTAMLLPHMNRIRSRITLAVVAGQPVLLKITPTQFVERMLDELVADSDPKERA